VISNVWKLSDCPKCCCSGLSEGEIRDGKTAVYQDQYCESCDWRSKLHRYRLVPNKHGFALHPDATFVRPDIALSLKLRGKFRLGDNSDYISEFAPQVRYGPSAPCPGCGREIEMRFGLRNDITAYKAYWECDDCGFQGHSGTFVSPGLFVPSFGYKHILWRGKSYLLTRNQRVIIEELHEAYKRGYPDVYEDDLLAKLGSPTSTLRDSFRRANKGLLGILIIRSPEAPRGTYRLNL